MKPSFSDIGLDFFQECPLQNEGGGITNSPYYRGKSLKKKPMLENFCADILKYNLGHGGEYTWMNPN